MKTVSIVRNKEEIKILEEYVDAFIVPLKDLSINYENYFTLSEINEINTEKELFVSINKNIHNNELSLLKEGLKKLKNVTAIIFYDVALVNLKTSFELVWAQEHLTTNYQTINFWYEKGVKYVYLSSEITKDEINEISEKTKSKIFLNVFGYLPMFTSRRHLVNSYLETFNKEKADNYSLYKEGKNYPVVDFEHGTTVYSDYILNITSEVKDLNIDYAVFNPFKIDINDYTFVLKNFKEGKSVSFEKNLGFLNKETIYKVKKDV